MQPEEARAYSGENPRLIPEYASLFRGCDARLIPASRKAGNERAAIHAALDFLAQRGAFANVSPEQLARRDVRKAEPLGKHVCLGPLPCSRAAEHHEDAGSRRLHLEVARRPARGGGAGALSDGALRHLMKPS